MTGRDELLREVSFEESRLAALTVEVAATSARIASLRQQVATVPPVQVVPRPEPRITKNTIIYLPRDDMLRFGRVESIEFLFNDQAIHVMGPEANCLDLVIYLYSRACIGSA